MARLVSFEQTDLLAPASREPTVRRSLLWLSIGFTVGSACLIALALTYLRSQTIESGTRLTQSFAQVIEEQTTRTIQTVDQRLQLAGDSMAQLGVKGQANEQSVRLLLRHQVKELPSVRAIWVMDAQGRIRYDSDEGNIGVSLADRPYFQIYLTQPLTGFYLGAPVRSRSTGTWLISAARPLYSSNGSFAGIIVAAVEPPYFDKLWRGIDLGAKGSIALFRSDGTLMMRSPFKDDAMGKKFSDAMLFNKHLPASPDGNYLSHSAIDGTLRTFAYRTLSSRPDLMVVVGQSFELMLAPWRQLASLALAIWAAASAAVILLCVFLNTVWLQKARAEATLRESEARYRTLFDCAPDGILITDPQGHFLDANASLCQMTGHTREALISKHLCAIIDPGEIEQIETGLNTIPAKLETQRYRRYRRKNGSVFDGEVISTLMPDGNVLGIVRDVSARRLAEQKNLDQLETLTRSDAEIRRLLEIAERSRRAMLGVLEDQRQAEQSVREKLDELLRWQAVTLGRQARMMDLKAEINQVLAAHGQTPRYAEVDPP